LSAWLAFSPDAARRMPPCRWRRSGFHAIFQFVFILRRRRATPFTVRYQFAPEGERPAPRAYAGAPAPFSLSALMPIITLFAAIFDVIHHCRFHTTIDDTIRPLR